MIKDTAQEELVFKALANGMRRQILDMIKEKPLTTGAICGKLPNIDRCTVMQHLGVLEEADLIIVRREGRFRWNHLNVAPLVAIYDRWISHYASDSARLLGRLKKDLE